MCLGDLVGYYADPNSCVWILRQRNVPCVRGNHDAVAARLKEPLDFSPTARRAIRWTQTRLAMKNAQFLRDLPLIRIIDDRFLIVHAALHPQPNEDLRLRSEEQAHPSFQAMEQAFPNLRLCFFGHTHRPAAYAWRNQAAVRLETTELRLDPSTRYLVNPGSVGQPRDGDDRAAFALYDADAQTIRFCRVPYDRATSQHKAQEAGLLPGTGLLAWTTQRIRWRLNACNKLLKAKGCR